MSFVDLSSNNGAINISQYAKYHRWISLKQTEGTGYVWQEGLSLAADAHAHGLHVIHYHWLRPDSSGTAQAEYFVNYTKKFIFPGDVVMCDYEWPDDHVPDPSINGRALQLTQFMQGIRLAMPGAPRVVYTNNEYLRNKPAMIAAVRGYPVVIANYSLNVAQRILKAIPNPYNFRYFALQYTQNGRIPTVSGPVDLNTWVRDPKKLFNF